MPTLWIVHRSPKLRAALQRLAGRAEGVVSGAPVDPQIHAAADPDLVLLGLPALGGDAEPDIESVSWEAELAFASRVRLRAPGARWILTAPESARDLALALFDNLPVEFFAYPPDPDQLRARLDAPTGLPARAALSERAARDTLAARFARWYGDLDLPALLRALDPALAPCPVLIRGEPGTGRGLVARYLHSFGQEGAALVHVPCHADLSAEEIEARLREAQAELGPPAGAPLPITLWLEEAERLPETTQRRLQAWLEEAAQPRGLRVPFVRFVVTTTPTDAAPQLHAGLRRALATLRIELPPLRERGHRIGAIASEALADWCHRLDLPQRRLGEDSLEVLEQCAWPGNLRELEAVVLESAVASTGDPILSTELRSEGRPLAPLEVASSHAGAPPPERPPQPEALPPSEPAPEAPEPAELAVEPAAESVREPEPSAPPDEAAPQLPAAVPAPPAVPPAVPRLAAALAREMHAPLETLRELVGLPDERLQDAALRRQVAEALTRESAAIEQRVRRVEALGQLERPRSESVDVVSLIEDLLAPHEETIRGRRLLVLKELDAARSHVLGDPEQLRLALGALVDKAFALVPERGDLYVASRHHVGRSGGDTIRVLLRFHGPERAAGLSLIEQSLEIVLAETVIQSMGGRVAVSSTEGEEILILLDLPAADAGGA